MKYIQFKNNNPFGAQAKMIFHIDRLYEYLHKGDTTPIEMEINLTNACNLSCKWCINSNFRDNESLFIDKFFHFCKAFRKMGGKSLVFSGGGEPTLHRRFDEAINIAKSEHLELGLMTNGVYKSEYGSLIGKNFKWVRFSVDTLDGEEYQEWKGVDRVKKVISNIVALIPHRIKIGINCNVGMDHTIEGVKKFAVLTTLVDYIQFRPVLPRYFLEEKTELNEIVWEYLLKTNHPIMSFSNDKLEDLRNKNFFPFRKCEGHHFVPILNANGDVCVCMYHPKDERFVFGNIYEDDFEVIWKSEKRKKVIEFVRELDYKRECQVCCKLTEINKFIDFIKHPEEGTDINFL